MRVLVVSTQGVGHIYPVVPLAQAAAGAGHEVLWAVPPDAIGAIEACGMKAVPAGLDRDATAARARELFPDHMNEFMTMAPREREFLLFPVRFIAAQGNAMLADLRDVIDQWRPDVILHEPMAVAVPPLAIRRGLPFAAVAFGAFPTARKLAVAEPQLRELWAQEQLDVSPWGGLFDQLYLHPLPASVGEPAPADTVRPMRPMCFDGATPGTPVPDWLTALGHDRPCVYVTFGTETPGLAPIGVIANALAAFDVDVVVTVGRGIDPASVPSTAPNVRIVQYVPQRAMLERASFMVSHAGSGALLGAATTGVPQLCLPLAADQFRNADAAVAAGLGISLEPGMVTEESVAESFRRLLDEPSFAEAARRVAGDFAALPAPADVVPALESLAQQR